MGYQTVNLGFGAEYMAGSLTSERAYTSGASDRVDLVQNIMEYFGKTPTTTPTGVENGAPFVNRLDCARPNPFNPATTIGFSLASEGTVSLIVYDVAGRVVRTLVEGACDAGPQSVVWDGTTDEGPRAASGVYFIRMHTPAAGGFTETGKIVLLK
jgi:hypothetical protein